MATRFYLSTRNIHTISQSPTVPGWDVIGGAAKRLTMPYKDASTLTNITTNASGAASPRSILAFQVICASGLTKQTISGNVKGQIKGRLSTTTGVTGCPAIRIKVYSHDGSTLRGTLLDLITGYGTNYTTTVTNRSLTSTALSSVDCENDDIIVMEAGWRYLTGTDTTVTGIIQGGSANASDLPEDNTTTAGGNGWIEFSQDLKFFIVQENLITKTENIDISPWTKGNTTVTIDSIQAPSDLLTADRMIESATTTGHKVSQPIAAASLTNGEFYCFSCYIKPDQVTTFILEFSGKDSGFDGANFDLSGLTMSFDGETYKAGIIVSRNGFYRVYFAMFIDSGADTVPEFAVYFTSRTAYLGVITKGAYIWGAQVNRGIEPAFYIANPVSIKTLASLGV